MGAGSRRLGLEKQRRVLISTIGILRNKLVFIMIKQVAQRATIAHLSLICPGQISFKKNIFYKWAMETRGPKSNSSELLCLSW